MDLEIFCRLNVSFARAALISLDLPFMSGTFSGDIAVPTLDYELDRNTTQAELSLVGRQRNRWINTSWFLGSQQSTITTSSPSLTQASGDGEAGADLGQRSDPLRDRRQLQRGAQGALQAGHATLGKLHLCAGQHNTRMKSLDWVA